MQVLNIFPYLDPIVRKSLLLITRVRSDPRTSPLREHLYQGQYPKLIAGGKWVLRVSNIHLPTTEDIYHSTFLLTDSDIANSLVSNTFRAIYYADEMNVEQERKEFMESYIKEIRATQGDDRDQVFDYRPWFSGSSRRPLHDEFPSRPALNQEIHDTFSSFRCGFADKPIFPRYSRRHMSYSTAVEAGVGSITGVEYERLYYQTGFTCSSPLEVRQTWKYNDLTPRTYFCQGGATYEASKYAQEIFNRLVDMFEVSHRRRRFDLARLDVELHEDVWVYDYSSFTSNHTEQKYFLQALATFCKGYPLLVFDVRHGIVRLDLGEYIDNYNRVCNILPEFELGPALLSRLMISAQRFTHRKGGALGVFGNLATCTVHHALTSLNISGSATKSSVVGDDGLLIVATMEPEYGEIPEMLSSKDQIKSALRLTGDINDKKFCILGLPTEPYQSQWTYLKRALTRHEEDLELWSQDHIITMALFLDENTTTLRKGPDSEDSSVASFLVQVFNLLLRVHRQQNSILDSELKVVCTILERVYYRFHLPRSGSFSGVHHITSRRMVNGVLSKGRKRFVNKLVCVIPSVEAAHYLRRHPIDNLLDLYDFSEPIKVPRMELKSDILHQVRSYKAGECFESFGERVVTIGVDMGLLSQGEPQMCEIWDPESYWEFVNMLKDSRYSSRRVYECLADLPPHFVDILNH